MSEATERYAPPGGLAVKDCALVAIATGRKARDLQELRDGIAEADLACIYYHFWGGLLRPTFDDPRYHNGFGIWVDNALHNQALAERLSVIDPKDYPDTSDLRTHVLQIIDSELEQRGSEAKAADDSLFDFIRSQIVVFTTSRSLDHPSELPEALTAMTRTSVFYHFIDARRRTPDAIDDFTTWLNDIDRDGYAELTDQLAGIDPFFVTLAETRDELARTFGEFFGKRESRHSGK
jgi:hypothetical protein